MNRLVIHTAISSKRGGHLIRLGIVNGLAFLFLSLLTTSLWHTATPVAQAAQPIALHTVSPTVPAADVHLPLSHVSDQQSSPHLAGNANISVTRLVTLANATLSQDWGDFDRDGYLDLALGSTSGISIYHNLAGQLVLSATLPGGPAYGVRWVDLNGDGRLELVAVGAASPAGQIKNPIYRYTGSGFIQTGAFTSANQLVRVVAVPSANFSNKFDLIASTNAISVACPVLQFMIDANNNFSTPPACVSTSATAAIGVGDFNNDGLPDLVLGQFPNNVTLLINHNGVLTDTNTLLQTDNSIQFDTSPFWPYDFSWGDYDGDGNLDLAVAFPLQQQVRIYHNEWPSLNPPFKLVGVIPSQRAMTPLSVDWGDFNGDGALDLAVADDPPVVYLNINQSLAGAPSALPIGSAPAHQQIWSARLAAVDKSNLSLGLTRQPSSTLLYQTIAGHLTQQVAPIAGALAANSVAWGDADGDGKIDLLMGISGTATSSGAVLYWNVNNTFSSNNSLFFPGQAGQNSVVAFGDLNHDGRLEAVVGTGNDSQGTVTIYYGLTRGGYGSASTFATNSRVTAVALGDFNSDSWLDVLVGTQNGSVLLFPNSRYLGVLSTPAVQLQQASPVRALAWADFNRDHYLDFAVATSSSVVAYQNNQNNTFTAIPLGSPTAVNTSLAWGDVNGDGFSDLALGTDGGGNYLFLNNAGTMSTTPLRISPAFSRTQSVAWADWDGNGWPDLAVGNYGEPNQVFANVNGNLSPVWTSDSGNTTGLAWGDFNNDGYLDLAVSRQDGSSGVYSNTSVLPWRLPNPPSYLAIARPGKTPNAYLYSASEILPELPALTVTINYTIAVPTSQPITITGFEYSLDGGSNWFPASPAITPSLPVTGAAIRAGQFIWNAQKDGALNAIISDNALFRIGVIDQAPVGPVQRTAAEAVSPPFRLRGGPTCQWPGGLSIGIVPQPNNPDPFNVKFVAVINDAGPGNPTITWDFGDGSSQEPGLIVSHSYPQDGVYTTTVTAVSADCPSAPPLVAVKIIAVGKPYKTYLPYIARTSSAFQLAVLLEPLQQLLRTIQTLPAIVQPAIQPAAPAVSSSSCLSITIPPASNPTVPWLSTAVGYLGQPVFNADGSRLAFWSTADFPSSGSYHNPDGNIELFYAQVDRAASCITVTQVTSTTGGILSGFSLGPSLNAAGDRLAFYSDGNLTGGNPDGNPEIFLARVDNAGIISVTQITTTTNRFNVDPSLNQAGTQIAFASDQNFSSNNNLTNKDGNQEIFVATIGANGQITYTQVTSTSVGTFNTEPAIDLGGQHIAFARGSLDPTFAHGLQEIYLAELNPVNASQITTTRVTTSASNIINYHPTIGGNGTRIAFAAGLAPAVASLATLSGAGIAITPIYTTTSPAQPALNTGDGSRLVVTSDGNQINVLDPAANATIPVSSCTGSSCVYPAISGDGMHVGYVSNSTLYVGYYQTASLSITLSPPITQVLAGSRVTYTFVLTDDSLYPADGVHISGALYDRPGVTLPVSLSTSAGGICSPTADQSIDCRLPAVGSNTGNGVTLTAALTPDPEKRDPIYYSINANAWQASSNPAAGSLAASTAVVANSDLIVKKSANGSAVAGMPLTYTLRITNAGPSTAANVVLTDNLPAGLVLITQTQTSGPPFTITNNGPLLYNTILSFTKNATATFSVVAEVPAHLQGGSVITNLAYLESAGLDPNLGNNLDSSVVNVDSRATLTMSKSAGSPVVAGEAVAYTLVVTNSGPSVAWSVRITDELPVSVTAVLVPRGCFIGGSSTVITCTLSNLDPNLSWTIAVNANVDANLHDGSLLTNTARVSASNVQGLISRTAVSRVAAIAGLAIQKSATSQVTAGNPVTYTLVVTNAGPSLATGTVITDQLPPGVSFVAASKCTETSNVVTCSIGDLEVNGSRTYTINATTAPSLSIGTLLANTAYVTATGATALGIAPASTLVANSISDLSVSKSAASTVNAGDTLTYTISLVNNGPSWAPIVTVTDQLSSSLAFLSASPAGNCGADTNGLVTCILNNLNVGAGNSQSVTITAQVSYTLPAGTVLNNTVLVTGSNALAVVNATATSNVRTLSRLAVAKRAANSVAPGQQLTYTLVLTNSGPSLATGIILTDVLPISVTFNAQTGANPISITPPLSAGQLLTWNLGTLTPNATNFITFNVNVTTAIPGPATLVNTAYATATTALVTASGTATTTAKEQASLLLTKTLMTPAIAGSNLTYRITMGNLGPSVVPTATITDALPVELSDTVSNVSTSAGCSKGQIGTGSNKQALITCTLTTPLGVGAEQWITITDKVNNNAGDLFTNTAYATATIATALVSGSVSTAPIIQANLLVTKTLSPLNAVAVAGASLTYSVTVGNLGPSNVGTASNVTMTDVLPSDLTYLSASTGCTSATGIVTCTRTGLNANSEWPITITGQLTATAPPGEVITNTAYATATVAPAIASDFLTSTVTAQASLHVSKTVSSITLPAGAPLTYTIVVSNSGPSASPFVTLTDFLTSALDLSSVATSPGCAYDSGTSEVTCPFSLDVGLAASQAFTITANISSTMPDGTPLVNTAIVTGSQALATVSSTVTTTVESHTSLAAKKRAASTVLAGNMLTYTIVVTNTGLNLTPVVTVTDQLTPSLIYQAGTPGCAEASNIVTCTLTNLDVGPANSQSILLTTTVNSAVISGTRLVNTAVVSGSNALALATSTVTTTARAQATLLLTKTLMTPAVAGSNLTYSITVGNLGPSVVPTVTITDALPVELSYNTSDVSTSGGCSKTQIGTGSNGYALVTCTLTTPLGVGAEQWITITDLVDSGVKNTFTNTAYAKALIATAVVSDPVSTAPAVQANLLITKTLSPLNAVAVAGANLTYSVTVGNTGPSDASSVIITDALPSGMSFVAASPICAPAVGSVVTCTLASTLTVGTQQVVTITGQVGNSTPAGTVITNTAYATSPAATSGVSDFITTSVTTSADLAVKTTVNPTSLPSGTGRSVTITVAYTNTGPSDAGAVSITSTLGTVLTYSTGSAVQPAYVSGPTGSNCGSGTTPQVCTWTISTLTATLTGTIVFTAAVPDGAQAAQIITSQITSTLTADPVPGNNISSSGSLTIAALLPRIYWAGLSNDYWPISIIRLRWQ